MPNTQPLLGIVIVAYKSRDEIGACLDSLPRQLSGRSVEIVVVDNSGNSDGTCDFVQSKYPHVRFFIPDENLGFGKGNNLGYQSTTSECVLFLNPDTVCNNGALESCVGRVLSEPEIGVISPQLVLPDGRMDLACRRSIPSAWDGFCRATGLAAVFPETALFAGYNLTHMPVEGTYEVGAVNGAFMLGRREVFERVGVFDESFFMYGDDLDLCIRVSRAGYRIVYDGRFSVVHIKGVSVGKDFDRMSRAVFDANRDVYLKHFNPRNSPLIQWKYRTMFGLWKVVALTRARLRRHRQVRPL